jgi:hypothetical protein
MEKLRIVLPGITEYYDIDISCEVVMDDNVWEYPFGDLDDEDDLYDKKPVVIRNTGLDSFTKNGFSPFGVETGGRRPADRLLQA